MTLEAAGVRAGYGDHDILHGVDVVIPPGKVTAIIGPNACGKSTLLRTMARLLPVRQGTVTLDGRPLTSIPTKQVAKRIGYLPQSPVAPDGIRVRDIVARGRFPHQTLLRQWGPADELAVAAAMERAGVLDLADRDLSALSGGQRQRVWLALTLAQEAEILLLDEPTTYLDLAHQLDVLNLCRSLASEGRTIVAVLHELNLAFRYADHLIVLAAGEVAATGHATEVITPALVRDVFNVDCSLVPDPVAGTPMIIPLER